VLDEPRREAWSTPAHITKGDHEIKFIYFHSETASDELNLAAIHQIYIFGSEDGGAAFCEECYSGHISGPGATECTPCPKGTSDIYNNTE